MISIIRIQYTFFLIILFLVLNVQVLAQSDSLVFSNGNIVVGELKSMDKGVATMETSYSDADFKIEWSQIREIYTDSKYLVTLSNGERYTAKLKSMSTQSVMIEDIYGDFQESTLMNIVYLKSVDEGFKSRFYASIGFGYNYTKANNLRQLSFNSLIGYMAERWSLEGAYSGVFSEQDEVEPIRRTEASITYRYLLPNDWFLLGDMSFLSNTEQKIDLRTNGKIGAGKFMIHTNQSYWAFQGGASFVNENFDSEASDLKSLEAFLGTELNLFDIGDFSLISRAIAYKGITEKNRWRFDFKLDAKYDLPLDFYVKAGFSANLDNQPTEGASSSDYVFQTSFGWEW